ncbi:MAG TPA: hypothetical protein VFO35_12015 [Steroidobacteraceae bacterium]|nr:hypothetical protein [Steroidobacteraceae bacterium]
MPDGAAGHERIFDFRTVVLTCAQLPHFIERFNLERNYRLSAPLPELIDDAWVLDLHAEDQQVRERARLIAAFVAFVDRTVWQPYVQKWRD